MSTRKERRARKLQLGDELLRTVRRPGPTKSRRAPVAFQADLTRRMHKQRMEAENDE